MLEKATRLVTVRYAELGDNLGQVEEYTAKLATART